MECLGLRWTSTDYQTTLSLLIYRTPNFTDAYSLNVATQYYYLQQGYTRLAPADGFTISGISWAAGLNSKNYVVGMSQGPAVISIFWQSETTNFPVDIIEPLTAALDIQISRLRDNGYLIQIPTDADPEE